MRKRRRAGGTPEAWLALVLLAATLPPSASGQSADERGAWLPARVEIKGAGPVAKSWERQLREIEAIVRENPALKDPRGYYPVLILGASPPAGGRGPWEGHVAFEAWWPKAIERAPDGAPRIAAKWEYNRPNGLWIGVNRRGDLSHWTQWEDGSGRFYLLPETRREVAGFAVVGDRLFITRPGKAPLFEPVPLERALSWVIADLKKQAKADEDGMAAARRAYEQFTSPAGRDRRQREIEAAAASQKKPENQAQERRLAEIRDRRREQDLQDAATPKKGSPQAVTADDLAALEKRRAGLTAADRTQPAWLKTEPRVRGAAGELVPPETPGARPLVTLSVFFDPGLPPDAMQLITVPLQPFEDQVKAGAREPQARAPLAVAEQTDWQAAQKLLR